MCKTTRKNKRLANTPFSHHRCKTINSVTYPLTIINKAANSSGINTIAVKPTHAVLLLI